MATSRAASRYPGVPHPTPASLRAPIHNPFDKFTATEFDAWIGDITGKLKRALGREELPSSFVSKSSEETQERAAPGDLSVYDDEAGDDSFAEVKARRAAKGKERAVDYQEEEEEEYDEEYDEDEEELEEREAESSITGWNRSNEYHDDEAGSGSGSDDAIQLANGPDEVIEILSDSDEEEEAPAPVRIGPPKPSQRQVHREEEDDEEFDEDYEEDELRSSPPGPGLGDHDMGYRIQRAEADDEEDDEEEEDEEDAPPATGERPVDIADPWKGPETFTEDYCTGGDVPPHAPQLGNAHLLPTQAVGEDFQQDEEQAEEFPPSQNTRELDVDLPDPWDGPRTYAEDFYSGGELRDDPTKLTPTHLTPRLTPQSPQEPEIISIDDSDDEGVKKPEAEAERRSRTRSPIREEDFDESSVNDLYAQLDEDDEHPDEPVKATTSSVRDTSPPHIPHERSVEKPRPAPTGHLDWNYPPAFPGRMATKAGHLKTPPEDPIPSSDLAVPAQETKLEPDSERRVEEEEPTQQQEHEILEISDDEDDDVGPAPLGTSDLVIPDDQGEEKAAGDDENDQLGSDDPYVEPNDVAAAVSAKLSDASTPQEVKTPPVEVELQLQIGSADDEMYAELESLYPMSEEFQENATGTIGVDFNQFQPTQTEAEADVMSFFDVLAADVQETGSKPFEEQFPSTIQEMFQVQSQFAGQLSTQAPAGDAQTVVEEFTTYVAETAGDASLTAPTDDLVQNSVPESNNVEEVAATSVGVSEQPMSVEPVIEYAVASMAPEEAVSEEHGTFTMPEEIPEDDSAVYFVTEVEETVTETVDPTSIADDVVTVGSEFASTPVNFEVEEPITEGRRTEEPDLIVTSIATTPAPESAVSSVESADAVTAIQEIASEGSGLRYVLADAESEDERPRRRRPHLVHTPSSSRANIAGPSTRSTDKTTSKEVEASTSIVVEEEQTDIPGVTVFSTQDETQPFEVQTGSYPRGMLASGIPMPVFADPNVRDPTSLGGSPGTTSPPTETAAEQPDNVSSLRDRLTATLVKKHTGHSPSGLFTPLTDGDGSPSISDTQPGSRDEKTVDVKTVEATEPQQDAVVEEANVIAEDVQEPSPTSSYEELHIDTNVNVTVHARHEDEDADGDADPDYVEQLVTLSSPVSESSSLHDVSEAYEAAPEGESDFAKQKDDNASASSAPTPIEATLDHSLLDNEKPSVVATSPGEEIEKQASDSEQSTSSRDTASKVPNQPRPLKRKRRSPPSGPPRVTRSMRGKGSQEPEPKPETTTPKSKGKERAQESDEENSIASSAEDNLQSPIELATKDVEISRTTSRASSVVSNLLDTSSVISQPSPTTDRPRLANLIRPFIHANGFLHHAHGRVAAALAQYQQQPQKKPPSSRASSSHSGPAEPAREEPSASPTPPSPAASAAAIDATPAPTSTPTNAPAPTLSIQTTSHTPVTRSNCKYRKISLPLSEGRPHVYFIVPGCSLSNASLMEEEHIQDHGDALAETSEQAVGPVETLGFNSYLIGILRRLVGVDLLRMNEIFYLPTPHDGFKRRKHRHRTSIDGRAMPSLSASAVKRLGGSTQHSPATKAPLSQADSISTSASSRKQGSQASKRSASLSLSLSASISDDELTDLEDAPPPKRRRGRPPKKKDEVAAASTENVVLSTSTTANEGKSKPRRSARRLHTDAAAYKPTEEAEDGTSEDEASTKRTKGKRKASGRKKRSRPADDQGEDNAERPAATTKRRKVVGKNVPS